MKRKGTYVGEWPPGACHRLATASGGQDHHMRLFHRSSPTKHGDAGLTHADYDAQSDLALPTAHHDVEPGDVATPFGGSVVQQPTEPGYDVQRDIGT